jgi:hypothetical protein
MCEEQKPVLGVSASDRLTMICWLYIFSLYFFYFLFSYFLSFFSPTSKHCSRI